MPSILNQLMHSQKYKKKKVLYTSIMPKNIAQYSMTFKLAKAFNKLPPEHRVMHH